MTMFKYNLLILSRNKIGNFMLIIFPLMTIFILGSALSSVMDPSGHMEPIKTGYVAGEFSEGTLAEYLKSDEMNGLIQLQELTADEAKSRLKENGLTAVIFDSENSAGEIRLYSEDGSDNNLKVLYTILNSYDKLSAAYSVYIEDALGRQDYGALQNIAELDLSAETIKETGLNNKAPNAISYYAVTMTVMIVLYAGMNVIDGVGVLLLGDLGNRISITPESKFKRIAGVIGANTAASIVQVSVSVIFSALVYGVSWGDSIADYITILCVYTVMTVFSISLATLVLLLTKNAGAAAGFTFGFAWVSTFLCKGYTNEMYFGEAEQYFNQLPNSLAQNAIFSTVYGGDTGTVVKCVVVLGVAAVVFLAVSAGLLRRRMA